MQLQLLKVSEYCHTLWSPRYVQFMQSIKKYVITWYVFIYFYLFFELIDFGLSYAVFYLKLGDKERLLKN